jgi:OTU domain-containing protein 6
VLQGDGSVVDVGEEGEEGARLWVAYYRHGFGLGEHYNSLRRAKPAVESSKTE